MSSRVIIPEFFTARLKDRREVAERTFALRFEKPGIRSEEFSGY